jgi:hypothetical protein
MPELSAKSINAPSLKQLRERVFCEDGTTNPKVVKKKLDKIKTHGLLGTQKFVLQG